MADDKQKIEQGVQLYFDSMYESDPAKVRAAFHPNAMITGYLETGLAEMTVDQFADFVESEVSDMFGISLEAEVQIISPNSDDA